VAISVLAISLTVILQLFSGGLKSSRLSDVYTLGTFHATEKMEEVLLSEALQATLEEGDFEDGYRWRTEIIQMEQTEEAAASQPLNLFQVTVTVLWGRDTDDNGRQIQLTTLKACRRETDT